MKNFLLVIGVLAILASVVALVMVFKTKSALHETEAILCVAVAVISFGAAGVIGAIERQTSALRLVIAAAAEGRLKLKIK